MKIGILSDIHEDVVRLEQALKIFEQRNVDEIICLGDSVGYCIPFYAYYDTRNANRVIDILRANCSEVVIGNHDLYAIRKLPDHRSFFDYPDNWYDLDFQERVKRSKGKLFLYEDNELSALLNKANLDYIQSLPEYIIKDLGDYSILLAHYAFPDFTGSATHEVWNTSELSEQFDFMDSVHCIYGFSGNDHFEGFRIFTKNQSSYKDFGFGEQYVLPDELTWMHGPTVSWGTFDNGILMYDTVKRSLEAIPLKTKKHVVPQHI